MAKTLIKNFSQYKSWRDELRSMVGTMNFPFAAEWEFDLFFEMEANKPKSFPCVAVVWFESFGRINLRSVDYVHLEEFQLPA